MTEERLGTVMTVQGTASSSRDVEENQQDVHDVSLLKQLLGCRDLKLYKSHHRTSSKAVPPNDSLS